MKLLNILLIITLIIFSSCGGSGDEGGTTTGNPQTVQLNIESYNVSMWNPLDIFIPKAYAGISNLTFCFKRLRFKFADIDTSDPNGSEDNIDFEIGEITINPSGTTLGSASVPAGTYRRIEFDLDKNCASGYSVDLNNDEGSFQSDDRITIKFSGNVTVSTAQTINLDIQQITDAIKDYDGTGNSIKVRLENVKGSF